MPFRKSVSLRWFLPLATGTVALAPLTSGCKSASTLAPTATSVAAATGSRPTEPPVDVREDLPLEESVVLAQRKRIMGRKRSLEMVSRVATKIHPIVLASLELPDIQDDLRDLARRHGMELKEFKKYWAGKQEADLMLESGGDPAAHSVSDAIGVAQFLASTGRGRGLKINVPAGRALSGQIWQCERSLAWWQAQPESASKPAPAWAGKSAPVWSRAQWIAHYTNQRDKLVAKRQVADERYDPVKAIRAQTRYLVTLARRYGGIDWALQAYHGGEGGVAKTINLYVSNSSSFQLQPQIYLASRASSTDRTGQPRLLPYNVLYERVTPSTASGCFNYLYGRSDDHRYYWWKVLMAERALDLYRRDPEEFKRQWQELKPGFRMEVAWYKDLDALTMNDRQDLQSAYGNSTLVKIPGNLAAQHVKTANVAPFDKPNAAIYKGLRPEAMGALLRLARLYRSNGGRGSLEVTSLVRTTEHQHALRSKWPESKPRLGPGETWEPNPEFHSTGLVFDIRRPATDWDRKVLEYSLSYLYDRLRISWLPETDHGANAYHVTPNPAYREEFVDYYRKVAKK